MRFGGFAFELVLFFRRSPRLSLLEEAKRLVEDFDGLLLRPPVDDRSSRRFVYKDGLTLRMDDMTRYAYGRANLGLGL